MPSELVNQVQLGEWLDYQRQSDIENWLNQMNIPYSRGKNRLIVTTLSAIEEAFSPSASSHHGYDTEQEASF